jgi:hypothetical protein
MAGLQAQAALGQKMARAYAARDSVTLSNLEQKNLAAEGMIRHATAEMVNAYKTCAAAKFKTC